MPLDDADLAFCFGDEQALKPDKAQVAKFLRALDPNVSIWTFQTFDDVEIDGKKRGDPKLARVIVGTLDESWPELEALQARGAGVFVTINETDGRGRKGENIVRVRATFADHDDTHRKPTEAPIKPHIVVDSSPGKSHRYWLTDCELGEFKPLQQAINRALGTDPSVQDLPRVLRLPGTLHQKDPANPHMVRIREISNHRKYAASEVRSAFSNTQPAANDGGWTGDLPDYLKRRTDPAANDALTAGLDDLRPGYPRSDANQIANRCPTIGHMRDTKGADQSENEWIAALQVLVRTEQEDDICHAWSSGHPEYSVGDCQAKIDHARTMRATTCAHMRSISQHCNGCEQTCKSPIRLGEPDTKTKRSGFQLTTVGDLLKPPTPLEWLIKGFLLPGCQAHLFGDSGTAKSFAALDWTCCIGIGRDWHGHKVKQGAVIYVAGEGHFGIRRRILAWATENNCIEEIKKAPIVVSSTGAQFTDSTSFNAVVEAIEEVESEHGQIALIIIDTLHRNLGGDENSADDISIYYRHADQLRDQFGATVLTVHHSGHSEKGRSRGSSAIRAATDCEFLMENTNVGTRRLSSTKVKDGPTPPTLHFTLKQVTLPWKDADGEPETSAVLEPVTAPLKPNTELTKTQQEVMAALQQAIDKAGSAVSEPTWREAYRQRRIGAKPDTVKKAFARAKKELTNLGEVEADGETFQPKRDTGQDRDIGGQSPEPQGDRRDTPLKGCPDVPAYPGICAEKR